MLTMLIDALRRRLGDDRAQSFQLFGEDLFALTGEDFAEAAAAWRAALERVPVRLRARVDEELTALQRETHQFLRRYNRSVHARVGGYVEIGRRCRFAYPWPVVAILGIEQVMEGMRQNRVYGIFGEAARRLGWRGLAELTDGSEDVLRRTNRGIFADSLPTVLLALRADELRREGQGELAAALVDGPLPPTFDEECRALARALFEGLAIAEPETRFATLARLTARHFAREQAIFTHHIGPPPSRPQPWALRRLLALRAVPAPVVDGRRVTLAPFSLPRGFDMRDHDARVALFARAFVDAITRNAGEYHVAVAHVVARWGKPGERADVR
ncbi:MAG TPA: hypothetical protein VGL86_27910 [Polyangia bacterium]